MGGDVTTKAGSQCPRQSDRVPLDQQIKIRDGSTKNCIPQRAADEVDRHLQGGRLPRDLEKKLQLAARQLLSKYSSQIRLHRVIVTDEIVYNPVDVPQPPAVPAWLHPCLVWIGLVLRIQRGSRTR